MITTELEGVVRPKIDTGGVVQGEQADEGEGKITMMDLNVTENVHAHVLCHEGFLGVTCSLLNIPSSILILHVSSKSLRWKNYHAPLMVGHNCKAFPPISIHIVPTS